MNRPVKDLYISTRGSSTNLIMNDYLGYIRELEKYCDYLEEKLDIKPKQSKIVNLKNKCGACKYFDYNDKCSIGCRCTNEIRAKKHKYKSKATHYKVKTNKSCGLYEERDDVELIYEYIAGKRN